MVCSHSLFELSSSENRKSVILNLWKKCDEYLVIVEEGTRRGFELVNEAREYILSLENHSLVGHVLAPVCITKFKTNHGKCNFCYVFL